MIRRWGRWLVLARAARNGSMSLRLRLMLGATGLAVLFMLALLPVLQAAFSLAFERVIEERLANAESVIFLAVDDAGRAIGLVQLYPSFSSVSAGRVYVLNDLFIAPEARRGRSS